MIQGRIQTRVKQIAIFFAQNAHSHFHHVRLVALCWNFHRRRTEGCARCTIIKVIHAITISRSCNQHGRLQSLVETKASCVYGNRRAWCHSSASKGQSRWSARNLWYLLCVAMRSVRLIATCHLLEDENAMLAQTCACIGLGGVACAPNYLFDNRCAWIEGV